MHISIVVAMDQDQAIGVNGSLPWHLPEDLKYFKRITMGKPIIMGRKTHDSIGRPLPGRENIVVTRNPQYRAQGCTVLSSIQAALKHCEGQAEVMIVGGSSLYADALNYANRLYLTEVHAAVGGDVFFPAFDRADWQECARESYQSDDKNPYAYSFTVLDRCG
jgi:dihydrofolate reductase